MRAIGREQSRQQSQIIEYVKSKSKQGITDEGVRKAILKMGDKDILARSQKDGNTYWSLTELGQHLLDLVDDLFPDLPATYLYRWLKKYTKEAGQGISVRRLGVIIHDLGFRPART
jgi:hypothetical protein